LLNGLVKFGISHWIKLLADIIDKLYLLFYNLLWYNYFLLRGAISMKYTKYRVNCGYYACDIRYEFCSTGFVTPECLSCSGICSHYRVVNDPVATERCQSLCSGKMRVRVCESYNLWTFVCLPIILQYWLKAHMCVMNSGHLANGHLANGHLANICRGDI